MPQIPDAALGIDIISVLKSISNASVKYQKSSEGLIEQMVMRKDDGSGDDFDDGDDKD